MECILIQVNPITFFNSSCKQKKKIADKIPMGELFKRKKKLCAALAGVFNFIFFFKQ